MPTQIKRLHRPMSTRSSVYIDQCLSNPTSVKLSVNVAVILVVKLWVPYNIT